MGRGRLSILFTPRFALIALVFAPLFSVIAGLQYLYVKTQLSRTSTATLADWASQVGKAIDYASSNNWNIKEYQQADIAADNYVVVANDGTLVEIVGFVPGLIGKVSIPLSYRDGMPLDFTSPITEHRRFATALAAFANSNASNVFVGVADRGAVRGIAAESPKEKEKALEVIKNLIVQYISPTITPEVGWVDHDGRTVMHIYVPRGDQPIYYVGGPIYVRQLASVQTARAEQVESMVKRFYGRRRF